jgi:hypothetical protein
VVTEGRDDPLRQPVLRRGSEGPSVRRLQQELVDAGIRTGVDGIFGRDTEGAVRSYQSSRSLEIDGIAGRATWVSLLTDLPTVPHSERPGRPLARPTPPATAGERTTTVQAGEGWWQIAQRALGDGDRFGELQTLNGGSDRNLRPGDVLQLPTTSDEPTTTVQAGEGWWQIAQRALGDGDRFGEIQKLNGGPDRALRPGDVLQLPPGK